ncbi:M42 family metallopeptidase [Desulfitobacterium chlororespirans]|uniref:Endoglucanase n=1 Tax=Desulfitobacterium chlororespirans DSM 11544 TaxID=1121395 RepID=A0A1M7UMU4_9FIRM|nr:M42 family metallopeptidase [Desulfitobacterium chlororespirans]SHN84270.1 endoglucanase [Desulfitobacterium chlororespirans DSM 11544]
MPYDHKPLDYTLLERLTQCFGPSGVEGNVSSLIAEEIHPYCDEINTDALGNLMAVRRGTGKKIMIAAHADEIGVMITHIDEKGFLRFAPLGGVSIQGLPHRRVQFQNGLMGTIGVEKLEKPTDLKLNKLYIDIGATSLEESKAKVQVGESAVFVGSFHKQAKRLTSKAMDDRVGCFIAIEVLKRLQTQHEVYFVFTVQEEVGVRGAQTAAFALEPDLALAVDVTGTGDTPKSHPMDVKLGQGVAIKVFDRSMITHPKIKSWMAQTAEQHHIPYQWEVLEFGGTDSGAIHLSKGGIPSGVVSIPTRYIHSPSEMVDQGDIEGAAQLLLALLEGPAEL